MKQFTRTILSLLVVSSFSSVNAQTPERKKTVVRTTETTTTKKDPTGVHDITTTQKDSIVGDSIYQTKIVSTKTVAMEGNSKVTTVVNSITRAKKKRE